MNASNVTIIKEQSDQPDQPAVRPVAGLPGGAAIQTQSEPQTATSNSSTPKAEEKIWNNGTAVVQLSRPLTIHGENGPQDISELVLTEPLYEVQCRLGDPVRQLFFEARKGEKSSQEAIVDHAVIMSYLVEMTGFNKGILSGLSLRDGRKCTQAVATLFQGEAGE